MVKKIVMYKLKTEIWRIFKNFENCKEKMIKMSSKWQKIVKNKHI